MSQPKLASTRGPAGTWSSAQSGGSSSPDHAELRLTTEDYRAILDELSQAHALAHERVARIYHLEQALDQAMLCLDALKLQSRDQQVLETQLACTEEFAHVQQHAIVRLRQQLEENGQILSQQLAALDSQASAFQQQLAAAAAETQSRQAALTQAQTQLAHSQAEQHRVSQQLQVAEADLETRRQHLQAAQSRNASLDERLEGAQQQIQDLNQAIAQLGQQLTQAEQALETQRGLEQALQRSQQLTSQQDNTIVTLQQDLAIAQMKVEELEVQLARQLKLQAKWLHDSQELEARQEGQQARITSLEQQNAEMQEQILKQARQAHEDETAIQHWKTRYLSSHRQIVQLKALLEQAIAQAHVDAGPSPLLNPALSDLLLALQFAAEPDDVDTTATSATTPRYPLVELPDFLIRRRSFRPRPELAQLDLADVVPTEGAPHCLSHPANCHDADPASGDLA